MLANQLPVPEIQVRQESTKASEIKSSRDNTRNRDFDRDMENSRRDQQSYQNAQETNRRQADGKEANVTREPKRGIDETEQRRDDKKRDRIEEPKSEVKTEKQDTTVVKNNASTDKNAHECEDCQHKEKSSVAVASGKLTEQTTEQKLELAEDNATSKWLDTILSLSSDGENGSEVNTDNAENTLNTEQISLSLVKDILASLGSETDLSELEGQEQVSLAQLKSMLTESELQAVIKVENTQTNVELTPEQEFEQLLAQLSGDKTNEAGMTEDKSNKEQKSLAELINQPKVTADTKNNETQQQVQQVTDKSGELKLTQATINQTDKIILDKQESKFKQSSLVNAMQLNSDSRISETEDKEPSKQSVSDLLAPTTKVLNISGTANTTMASASASETATSFINNTNSVAAQAISEQPQLNGGKLSASELDMSEMLNKESSENKLTSLLGSLAPEEVKTSDVASKAEKVNVAGVTLDKTLQMPKLENMAQAKNEVVVRENILFNKQELANQMQTQVGMMMARNMKSVDIRLDPPELGSMQLKLSVQNDQASVSFVVSNQQAKDALENSLPKLKELLEQQGLQLADSDVQQQQSQAQNGAEDEEQGISKNGLNADVAAEEDELEQQQQMINRAINSPWNVSYYA